MVCIVICLTKFKVDSVQNKASKEQNLLHIFDLFYHVQSLPPYFTIIIGTLCIMTTVFRTIRVFIFMIALSLSETTNRIRIRFAGLLSSSAQYMLCQSNLETIILFLTLNNAIKYFSFDKLFLQPKPKNWRLETNQCGGNYQRNRGY